MFTHESKSESRYNIKVIGSHVL